MDNQHDSTVAAGYVAAAPWRNQSYREYLEMGRLMRMNRECVKARYYFKLARHVRRVNQRKVA